MELDERAQNIKDWLQNITEDEIDELAIWLAENDFEA